MNDIELAAENLAREITSGHGIHRTSTLNAAQLKLLHLVHLASGPPDVEQLAQSSGFTWQYVYRMIDEMVAAGILVATQHKAHPQARRARSHFQCICSTQKEGATR